MVGPGTSRPVSLMETDACLGVSRDSPPHLGSAAGPASSSPSGGGATGRPSCLLARRPIVVGMGWPLALGDVSQVSPGWEPHTH